MLCFAPVLCWNAAHGWASFAKQGGRTGDWRPADALRHFAELLGSQIGLGTPLVALLCAAGVWVAARRWRQGPAPALLAALTVPGVARVPAARDRRPGAGELACHPVPRRLHRRRRLRAALLAAAAALGFAIGALVYLQAATACCRCPAGWTRR